MYVREDSLFKCRGRSFHEARTNKKSLPFIDSDRKELDPQKSQQKKVTPLKEKKKFKSLHSIFLYFSK